MTSQAQLDVVLCWHMHQPMYRRASDGEFALPWAYLHAIKDYPDMAWHLERTPEARAVVNFTPVLLDQIEDYSRQFASGAFRDPVLRVLAEPDGVAPEDRPEIIASLFRANVERMIKRLPSYARLLSIYEAAASGGHGDYLSSAFVADAAVLYHLAWLAESVRRTDPRVSQLVAKSERFDAGDRALLLAVLGDVIAGVIPRYRALAADGRVELSTSPYAHPILPLLIDFQAARESLPAAPLPNAARYPDGYDRASKHVQAAIESHRRRFGSNPAGCWPSEGAVSQASVALLADAGFTWTATCESVLVKSLREEGGEHRSRSDFLYRPYRVIGLGRELPCFFRDVHLSDLIGFRYAEWHADDAVANLVSELVAIADASPAVDDGEDAVVVSIILDGENAWEHYPENGFYFLSGLYRALASHPRLRLTTFSGALARQSQMRELSTLVAGSWVYGTLSTWIGDPDKNRAWDLLVAAKDAFDAAAASGRLTGDALAAAEAQLKVCEGSDWFWWFGDYNPAQTVSDFDRLFRRHLADLYALIGTPAPPELGAVIGVGTGSPVHGGTMRESAAP